MKPYINRKFDAFMLCVGTVFSVDGNLIYRDKYLTVQMDCQNLSTKHIHAGISWLDVTASSPNNYNILGVSVSGSII